MSVELVVGLKSTSFSDGSGLTGVECKMAIFSTPRVVVRILIFKESDKDNRSLSLAFFLSDLVFIAFAILHSIDLTMPSLLGNTLVTLAIGHACLECRSLRMSITSPFFTSLFSARLF